MRATASRRHALDLTQDQPQTSRVWFDQDLPETSFGGPFQLDLRNYGDQVIPV